MKNNGRMAEQTLDKIKRRLSIQEILSREWKLGLAALFCQKNENEIVTGLFIAEERRRKQAQAQQTTARRHTYAARRFAPNRATARRQGATDRRFASNLISAQRPRQVPSPRLGPPNGEFCRRAVSWVFFSSIFFLNLESKTFIFNPNLHFHQNCYKTMQNKHNIAKNSFWLSTDSFIEFYLILSSF